MTRLFKISALAAATAGMLAATAPAVAAPQFDSAPAQVSRTALDPTSVAEGWDANRRYDRDRRYYGNRNYYGNRGYRNQRAYYGEPVYRDTRTWRGRDGRYYCRKKDGTTGLIIGGAAGALLGREIDGGYDRTLGTVLGAAGGALLGREIDRGGSRCR